MKSDSTSRAHAIAVGRGEVNNRIPEVRDWLGIVGGLIRSVRRRGIGYDDPYARLGWLLIVGTIPAGFLGLIFESRIEDLFASPQVAAAGLIVNGALLFIADRLQHYAERA